MQQNSTVITHNAPTTNTFFQYGSHWVRADFHLHTKADKEFSYNGDENSYISDYVQALKDAHIKVGVITNHNKFDYNEFKILRKKAKKENIYLLPGVELSIGDGATGVHTLITFSESWIEQHDFINPFLTTAFNGAPPAQYENANGRTSCDIINTLKRLEESGRDFFVIFAHVEDRCGLWKELGGGRLEEIGTTPLFKQHTLGFQKVRTRDARSKVQSWLKGFYPAEVEGSDPKKMDEIGKGKETYIKIGDYNFDAIKYALLDFENRVSTEKKEHAHSHIQSIAFEGGILDAQTITLSPELNTLIGVRGSGKSAILEAIAYGLGIECSQNDKKYKEGLLKYTLRNGGKITIKATNKYNQQFDIVRIYGDSAPTVYQNGELMQGITVRETIIHKPMYFGQKDLASQGEEFNSDLIEKIMGDGLKSIREEIETQGEKVVSLLRALKKNTITTEKKEEYIAKKKDAEFKLGIYKENGVEEKLQQQINYDTDLKKIISIINKSKHLENDIEELVAQHEDEVLGIKNYTFATNQEFFTIFLTKYDNIANSVNTIKQTLSSIQATVKELETQEDEFKERINSLKENFAEIERNISTSLVSEGINNIDINEFKKLRETINLSTDIISNLDKEGNKHAILTANLIQESDKLNKLRHKEYTLINTKLQSINNKTTNLKIDSQFKGDKDSFLTLMKSTFRGSNIRSNIFEELSQTYSDFFDIYRNIDTVKNTIGNLGIEFEVRLLENLEHLILFQVKNTYELTFRGTSLAKHSLGQRASALIIFVFNQHENDVFIIDQPEDDLDNQTIYNDVIKIIKEIKPKTQFIFATHNANFPVLGDAEQVIACNYTNNLLSPTIGSIDSPILQRQIVSIMEGGNEAFNQRKRRYEIWKSANS